MGSGKTAVRQGALSNDSIQDILTAVSNGAVAHYTGSADVLDFPGIASLDTAGVDALTLATPVSGPQPKGDDGKMIIVYDSGGHAHTITTASNKVVPSHSILTFGGAAGANVVLQAVGGLWYVVGTSLGVVAS